MTHGKILGSLHGVQRRGDRPAKVLPDRPRLAVKEAAAILGVNVRTLYAEIHAGKVQVLRAGNELRVPNAVLASIVGQGHVETSGGGHGHPRMGAK